MSRRRDNAAVVGVGAAAACAVCCAGPILGILAAIGLTTAASVAVFGLIGLAIAALAIPVIVRRRSRTTTGCATVTEPVIVMLDASTGWQRPAPVDATTP